jgi:nucleotide-binding universal stress UspA family protein
MVDVPTRSPVIGTSVTGPVAPCILAEADKHASDLIVVGARGLGVVKRMLLGSVSEAVLRHANCPVLIVHRRPDEVG